MSQRKKIVILGATGSIGESAFWVADKLRDHVDVVGLAAASRWERLAQQARILQCEHVAIADAHCLDSLRSAVPPGTRCTCRPEAVVEMVTGPDVDMVLCAITGTDGFEPVLAAVRAGKDIALASKEILVMAGELVMAEVERSGVRLIPVDSEHSAIFQCLESRTAESVRKLVLTASGGPFRETPSCDLDRITPRMALEHPTWNMGPKITIDSATLFNKALEVIEARWLFGIPGDHIDVVIHPQSIIHSAVEFIDGGMLAQLGLPDMKLPIQYALLYPERIDTGLPRCSLPDLGALTFEHPRHKDFPALGLARAALHAGGTMPTVLNAANEVAVAAFREGLLSFTGIAATVSRVMQKHTPLPQSDLDCIRRADAWARKKAEAVIISAA